MMQIFFFCRKTSPYMTFWFVDVQYFSGTFCEGRIYFRKTFCNIFMHRTFADPKLFRCLTHGCIVINNIFCYLNSSFLNITFQKNPLRYLFLHCMQGIFLLCHYFTPSWCQHLFRLYQSLTRSKTYLFSKDSKRLILGCPWKCIPDLMPGKHWLVNFNLIFIRFLLAIYPFLRTYPQNGRNYTVHPIKSFVLPVLLHINRFALANNIWNRCMFFAIPRYTAFEYPICFFTMRNGAFPPFFSDYWGNNSHQQMHRKQEKQNP